MVLNADAERTRPATWPLGALALGVAAVALLMSVTYVLSPVAYLVAVVAFPLAVTARTDGGSRRLGTVALVLAVLAVVGATAVLLWI